ncbi:MAG TPA: peptide-methionine (S)-S-oxide reductase MsrA [Candidatus Udaeobacter sp.]|jgi:peptide-methionine (S)-S-oxide reductase|nr:peptide-methionine (S)-S-oxide reductase MsrA [Candidatus Udaeobacter sp.]
MSDAKVEIATLGGGCFWCLEAAYTELRGVQKVVSGYAGGRGPATYEEVCSGRTGHAEVVQITFDPEEISYSDLLDVFFTIHDPTTPNRQGADVGTQYRSVIFHHSPEQKKTAEQAIARLETDKVWRDKVVTQIVPFTEFFPAEEYHQHYFERNPAQPYCQAIIAPKVAKLRKQHFERLRV